MHIVFRSVALMFVLIAPGLAHAVQSCELNGQPVNTSNGNTTAGKTGLIRCRDAEGGPVVREEELQNGKFMGLVRRFREGVLEREHSVNEKGNRETRCFDNGRVSSEGLWFVKGRYDNQATGTHKGFDDQGRLRSERFYDARGHANRERELDDSGRLLRDEELFEDGSRKAFTR